MKYRANLKRADDENTNCAIVSTHRGLKEEESFADIQLEYSSRDSTNTGKSDFWLSRLDEWNPSAVDISFELLEDDCRGDEMELDLEAVQNTTIDYVISNTQQPRAMT